MNFSFQAITKSRAASLFILGTAYFYGLLYGLLPLIKSHFLLNSAVYWFITGYALFIPLLGSAVALTMREGNRSFDSLLSSLSLRRMSPRDWRYALLATLAVFVLSGIIFGASMVLNTQFGIRPLETTPWFISMSPFEGQDKLLLLIWLPMFAFNILGEELLWRGYIQTRLPGENSWIFCSFLWLLFHLPFGTDLIIMLLPILFIVPYVFHKTRNTLVGVFIHAVYNGPLFILVALGLIK